MQASKIELNQVYAMRRKKPDGDYELVRFRPSSVTTTRYRATGSPHDYRSTVKGWVVEDAGEDNKEIEIDPDKLLGLYSEHKATPDPLASSQLRYLLNSISVNRVEALEAEANHDHAGVQSILSDIEVDLEAALKLVRNAMGVKA